MCYNDFNISESMGLENRAMVSYNKLWKMLIDKNLSKTELTRLAGISTNAMAKLGRNEDVRVKTLEKLCTSLDCKLDDIVEVIPEEKPKKGN